MVNNLVMTKKEKKKIQTNPTTCSNITNNLHSTNVKTYHNPLLKENCAQKCTPLISSKKFLGICKEIQR